jgi:plastocyanin
MKLGAADRLIRAARGGRIGGVTRRLLLAVLAIALLVGVGLVVLAPRYGDHRRRRFVTTPPAARPSAAHRATVSISGYDFHPKDVRVATGARVTWVNHDATPHTATADHGRFDTGTIAAHASRTTVFAHPGTYTYHCVFHAFMTATITVR